MAMAIASPQIRSFQPPKAAAAPQPEKPAQAPTENFTRKEIDPHHFSWGDAGRGLVGAVVNAGIYGAGATAETILKTPKLLYTAEKGLWTTKQLGPVIKATVTPLLVAAGIAAPLIAAIGGTGYGLYKGFVTSAEKGIGESCKEAVGDLRKMHGVVSQGVIDGMNELAAKPLAEGQKPFDISILGGVKGLAGAVVSGAIDGAGIGVVTLAEAPRAFYKVNKAIWQSDAALPLKTIGSVLTLPATPLAVGLGVVGGAVYGMGMGAKDGYTDGLGKPFTHAASDVHKFAQAVNEGISHLDK